MSQHLLEHAVAMSIGDARGERVLARVRVRLRNDRAGKYFH
jgi:hypothetical protein